MVPWTLAERNFAEQTLINFWTLLGSSCCSTAVEQLPCDHEIMGSDPAEFEFSLFCVLTHYLCHSLVCPSTGPSSRSNANEFPSKYDLLLQLQLGDRHSLMCTETAKHNICLSFQCSAVAAVAQPVWHPELRSLWEEHTKQTWVWFPVVSDEVGENSSRAIYDANIEVRMQLQTHFYRMFSATNLVTRLWQKLVPERLSVDKFYLYSNFIYKRHWWFPIYRAFFVLLYHKAIDVDKNWYAK